MVWISVRGWFLEQPSWCCFCFLQVDTMLFLFANYYSSSRLQTCNAQHMAHFRATCAAGGQLINMLSLCVGLGSQVFFHLRSWKVELIVETSKDLQFKWKVVVPGKCPWHPCSLYSLEVTWWHHQHWIIVLKWCFDNVSWMWILVDIFFRTYNWNNENWASKSNLDLVTDSLVALGKSAFFVLE